MTSVAIPTWPLLFMMALGCSNADRRCPPQDFTDYRADLCCEGRCLTAHLESTVEQPYFDAEVCIAKLQDGAPDLPACCASRFGSPLCERSYLASCEGESVLEHYSLDLGEKDSCAAVEIRLPIIDDARTSGRPVLVVVSGISYGRMNHCAVLDLRRSVVSENDTVTIHGHALSAQPGFDPPPACPNTVEGPALNDPPPDGGI